MKSRAFTLIELLIVVSIISLLVLSGFFLARSQFLKGRDARRKSDIHKIQEAVEEYEKDHDCYPKIDLVSCKLPLDKPGTGLAPYLSQVPCDPATGDKYYYENDSDTCAKWYRIFIFLDNQGDKSIIPGIGPGNIYNFYLASPNAPVPISVPTPVPTPVPSTPSCSGQTYGCRNGSCVPIDWKPDCSGPVCLPGFNNDPDCGTPGNCGSPLHPLFECTP